MEVIQSINKLHLGVAGALEPGTLSVLLGGIQGVRAHFYASFHSGRRDNNPISRETLRELTGVPERTQYVYEQTAGVSSQQNIAVGEPYTTKNAQERAWQHGWASFRFVDVKGKQGGRPNREYVAWRLPNSYEGPHRQRSKEQQKKINRELVDLVNTWARGNGQEGKGKRTLSRQLFGMFWLVIEGEPIFCHCSEKNLPVLNGLYSFFATKRLVYVGQASSYSFFCNVWLLHKLWKTKIG